MMAWIQVTENKEVIDKWRGEIIAKHIVFEQLLNDLIAMAFFNEEGLAHREFYGVILSRIRGSGKIDVFKELYENTEEYKILFEGSDIKAMKAINDLRNIFAHGEHWRTHGPNKETISTLRKRRDKSRDATEVYEDFNAKYSRQIELLNILRIYYQNMEDLDGLKEFKEKLDSKLFGEGKDA